MQSVKVDSMEYITDVHMHNAFPCDINKPSLLTLSLLLSSITVVDTVLHHTSEQACYRLPVGLASSAQKLTPNYSQKPVPK